MIKKFEKSGLVWNEMSTAGTYGSVSRQGR